MLGFREFLDYAERLYEDAQEPRNTNSAQPYIIGSILSSWMAIESFINNMMEDFASLPADMFTVHERGFLLEKQVKFEISGSKKGKFCLQNKEEFRRLDDKILFLIARFGGSKSVDKGAHIWQRFEKMKEKRNSLSHPRSNKEVELTLEDAQEAINVSKEIMQLVSKKVWGKSIKW